jgi:AAA+ superfamily predicted ATPase
MDVVTPPVTDSYDVDPKQELIADVERVRTEREELERQIAADRERFGPIRHALDNMVHATWRDMYRQQQGMRDRENLGAAATFGWLSGYQWVAMAVFVLASAGAIYALQTTGVLLAFGAYILLAVIGYAVARDQCLAPLKKARLSYLGEDGKDVRFVAFSHLDMGLNHPLIGFDGPTHGQLEDRAWKIPGVREKDALDETFIEVIDERRSNVLLTRYPDRKPTLVHADLENPFLRAYGVMFQRALERHMNSVRSQGEEFREIVKRMGKRKDLDERLRKLEAELAEFDGTAAIMRSMPVSVANRDKLTRRVVLFRLGDPSVSRGMFLITGGVIDMTDVMQTLSRASAATLLQLSFSQIKIGYVGQGAATVSRIFATAKRARSIIFIDEAERFFSVSGSAAYESMRKEVVQAILQEWEGLEDSTDVWVVAAAKTRDGLDDGVVARFGALIDLSPQEFIPDRADDPTRVIDGTAAAVELEAEDTSDVVLPDVVSARGRLLAAMFAHCNTMESQGINVPRAVLIAGPSRRSKQAFIDSLVEQTSLPLIEADIDDIDSALRRARDERRSLISVDVPEYGDPGSIAHLAVLIDELTNNKAQTFILATTKDEAAIDPELRSRFPEFIDLTELDGPARREKLRELLGHKPLDFDLEAALDHLESQTDGMTFEQLRHFVDEAARKAALRAIEAGVPDHIRIGMADFERRSPAAAAEDVDDAHAAAEDDPFQEQVLYRAPEPSAPTKDDEAAL